MAVDKAPYDKSGNLLHYPMRTRYDDPDPNDWRPNIPFTAALTLTGTRRGRSAAYFTWEDSDGHEFPMFITDVAGLLRETTVTNATVCAVWTVAKRGTNYGVRFHALPAGSGSHG